jgi:hypothetical protein
MSAAHRRLLDLLAGWGQYVDDCIENAESTESRVSLEDESEAIHDLYQRAGSIESMTDLDVSTFMRCRVERLLWDGPTQATSKDEEG